MTKYIFGSFLILHGLVFFLYLGVSQAYFDAPDMGWSIKSWLWSDIDSSTVGKNIAFVLYSLSILVYVSSGIIYLLELGFWREMILGAAIFTSLVILFFWDGQLTKLPDQGFIGILINLIIIFLIYRVEQISSIMN